MREPRSPIRVASPHSSRRCWTEVCSWHLRSLRRCLSPPHTLKKISIALWPPAGRALRLSSPLHLQIESFRLRFGSCLPRQEDRRQAAGALLSTGPDLLSTLATLVFLWSYPNQSGGSFPPLRESDGECGSATVELGRVTRPNLYALSQPLLALRWNHGPPAACHSHSESAPAGLDDSVLCCAGDWRPPSCPWGDGTDDGWFLSRRSSDGRPVHHRLRPGFGSHDIC